MVMKQMAAIAGPVHTTSAPTPQRSDLAVGLHKAMSSHKEELVVKELLELKNLEIQLQMKWKRLKRAGKGVRAAFVSSLGELETRAQQLEGLLDSPKPRAA
jgi:hypothetical protein